MTEQPTTAMEHGYTCAYCTGDGNGNRPNWPHREGYEHHMQTVHRGLAYEWSPARQQDRQNQLRQAEKDQL